MIDLLVSNKTMSKDNGTILILISLKQVWIPFCLNIIQMPNYTRDKKNILIIFCLVCPCSNERAKLCFLLLKMLPRVDLASMIFHINVKCCFLTKIVVVSILVTMISKKFSRTNTWLRILTLFLSILLPIQSRQHLKTIDLICIYAFSFQLIQFNV